MKLHPARFIKEKAAEIKRVAKERKVLIAVSGGVDSVTCAFLAHRGVGNNLIVLFLDTGLMRENEPQEVVGIFSKIGIELQVWEVQRNFFDALKGKTDPEEKRKAFRDTFYRTLGQALKSYSADILVQGTIAADIVETQKGIKTQHNVLSQIGINPATFGLKICEPLKELYKDQVRVVARHLGVPKTVCERKPFPGPGLSVRIIGEVTPERVEIVRTATTIVEHELRIPSVFQAFPVLFNDHATGMVGGRRVLGEIIAIRAVESKNALTATPCALTWARMASVRDKIIRRLPQVVKVVYDITAKPPSTIEYI